MSKGTMDEYERKFTEMQKYIPFLEAMIDRLKKVTDKSRESQLQKMQSLHGILLDRKRKLKFETLLRCEDLLQSLHSKVEKGNAMIANSQSTKIKEETKPSTSGIIKPKTEMKTEVDDGGVIAAAMTKKMVFVKKMPDDETPASPSPPASPDGDLDVKVNAKPIIIPTERSDGLRAGPSTDDRPASPDACELIGVAIPPRAPIIIPTEREVESKVLDNPLKKVTSYSGNKPIPRWSSRTGETQSNLWKTEAFSSSKSSSSRPRVLLSIPTQSIPSTPSTSGSVLRKPVLVLEKKTPDGSDPDDHPSSSFDPTADSRLRLPDRDSHFSKASKTSQKTKDLPTPGNLLEEKPGLLSVPPLSQEDLADLLHTGEEEKKPEKEGTCSGRLTIATATAATNSSSGTSSTAISSSSKDPKNSKIRSTTHKDSDIESDRRWEEVDKHIVKPQASQSSRKSFDSPTASNKYTSGDRPTDPRVGRNRESTSETRLADNYEKHPRQSRDTHKSVTETNSFTRKSTDPESGADENRGSNSLYQRRPLGGRSGGQTSSEIDPRKENNEFYKGIMQREREKQQEKRDHERKLELQQERERDMQREHEMGMELLQGPTKRGMVRPSPSGVDPATGQWPQNYPANAQPQGPPNIYPHPQQPAQQQRPDMWMPPGANNMPMSGEPPHNLGMRQQPPYQVRPPMNPQDMNMPPHMDMNMGPCMDQGFRDEPQNPANIGMMQPQNYPMGPQYHQFPQDNRPNVQQFDRQQDFPHNRQSWEGPPAVNRLNNSQYSRSQVPSGQWNRNNRGPGGPPSAPTGTAASPMMSQPLMMHPMMGQPQPPLPLSQSGPTGQPNRNLNERPRGPINVSPSSGSSPHDRNNPHFNRDPRDIRDPRDPRMRNSDPASSITATPAVSPGSNVRRDRFSKENPQPPPVPPPVSTSKPKETPGSNNHGRRRPNCDPKAGGTRHLSSTERDRERDKSRRRDDNKKPHHQKNFDPKRLASAESNKSSNEKAASKDVMRSPLESLYGAIDTSAKTGKGYGKQTPNFKIPKIRRPETATSTTQRQTEVVTSVNVDDSNAPVDETTIMDSDLTEIPRTSNDADDKKSEVTSTTREPPDESQSHSNEIEASPATRKLSESEEIVDSRTKNLEDATVSTTKEPDAAKNKEELTEAEELFQALLFKSMKCGPIMALLKQSNLLLKTDDARQRQKKLMKIQQIIASKSSSSSEQEEEQPRLDKKKAGLKKKRRVNVIESSEDEEPLEQRLNNTEPVEKLCGDEITGSRRKSGPRTQKEDSGKKKAADVVDDEEKSTNAKVKESATRSSAKRKNERRKGKSVSSTAEKVTSEEDKNTVEAEKTIDEAPATKIPPKPKPKRRNSLEMLQEDIREMFISQDVVTATGPRLCRVVKEAHQSPSADTSSKKGANSGKNDSEPEESPTRPESVNARRRRGKNTGMAGGRGLARSAARKSKKTGKEQASSDSETEGSVRTDTNTRNETSESTRTLDESSRVDSIESLHGKDDCESSHFLRRSERVGLRESGKDTKQDEKTDKQLDSSSRTMFDSSSDESFGIDVTELTAAVDISLHPERRGRGTDHVATKALPTGKKTTTRSSRRTRKNAESVPSGDDNESIASDLSRTSSLNRGKIGNTTLNDQPDTNEDLLSDLLTGLVDPNVSNTADEQENDHMTGTTDAQKGGANQKKKKKKKPGWSFGIVRKKKKKLQLSPIATPSIESEFNNPRTKSSLDEPSGVPIITAVPSMALKTEEDAISGENNDAACKSEPCSPTKKSDVSGDAESIDEKKPLDELLMDDFSVDPTMEVEHKNFSLKKLISYTWSSRKERFNCLYCPWLGKNIVHHYTLSHGDRDVMISRLPATESRRAMSEALAANHRSSKATSRAPKTNKDSVRKFKCRFCSFKTVGAGSAAVEAFYEHCTTHTGEYRFICNGCTYRTVAKSSMRTHYYRRACLNKNHGNIHLAICEEPVPEGDFLFGYMCSKCHFVQLKESNVEQHIKMHHENLSNVEIVKIDMSSRVDTDLADPAVEVDAKTELKEENDSTLEQSAISAATEELSKGQEVDSTHVTGSIVDGDPIDIVDEPVKDEEEVKNEDVTPARDEPSMSQEMPAGNLNAFVCPPELENKEDEIQLERQKKMQEIVKNIGISVHNMSEKRDLSIIDKLKDKMMENLDESLKVSEEVEKNEERNRKEAEKSNDQAEGTSLPVLLIDSVTSLAPTTNENDPEDKARDECTDKTAGEASSPKDDLEPDADDKSEKKLKDPLANLDEASNKDESSDEESDQETGELQQPPAYESDSSEEQSDGDLPADVNSFLEETLNSSSASAAPMMTTIQRLAAKLQNEKPFTPGLVATTEEVPKIKVEEPENSEELIPKKPNVVPISSIQKFFGKRSAAVLDSPMDADQPEEKMSEESSTVEKETPEKTQTESPPKKFIRLRRLSGDMLSVPGPTENSLVAQKPSTSAPEEEKCSFIRIENVMSLASSLSLEDTSKNLVISDVRSTAVPIPVKSPPATLSLLKKNFSSSPRPVFAAMTPITTIPSGNVTIRPLSIPGTSGAATIRPTTAGAIRSPPITTNLPIRPAPTSPLSSTGISRPATISAVPMIAVPQKIAQNFKIVKLAAKVDNGHRIFGITLKSVETFRAMLEPTSLRQFYKCMARTCWYTTDSEQYFGIHFNQHLEAAEPTRKGPTGCYDFQRCAYCSDTFTTWRTMSDHLKEKHSYCRYQCGHCFYRAVNQSYVEIHCSRVHRNQQEVTVYVGQKNPVVPMTVDRREFVSPFECKHECGKSFYVPAAFMAHLRSTHCSSLSILNCHLCSAASFKPEQLIAHYKLHGIATYQCLYCLFGAEQAEDVHAHLSAYHYNRPAHILERNLPGNPDREKTVIDQLLIVHPDINYKYTQTVLEPNHDAREIIKRSDSPPPSGSFGDLTIPVGKIGMSRLFPHEKPESIEPSPSSSSHNSPAVSPKSVVLSKVRKILPKPSMEPVQVVIAGSYGKAPTSGPGKNATVVGSLPIAKPLSHRSNEDSIQVLDNPESQKMDGKEVVEEVEQDDSDIEILEDVTPIKSSEKTVEALIVGKETPDEKRSPNVAKAQESVLKPEVTRKGENSSKPEVMKKGENSSKPEVTKKVEDASKPVEAKKVEDASKPEVTKKSEDVSIPEAMKDDENAPKPEEVTKKCDSPITEVMKESEDTGDETMSDGKNLETQTKFPTIDLVETVERPKTLDDIRHTGFTGEQLYKCGYDGCDVSAETADKLRCHIRDCFFASDAKSLQCVHCGKRFVKTGFLVEHFKFHGLKRFGCSMCQERWAQPYQAMGHMKTKHKQTYTKLIPADPKNPSAEGLFVVEPIPTNGTSRKVKRGKMKSYERELESFGQREKTSYGPLEIDSLPRQAIYQREIGCSVCTYTTKVRTNIIRHLLLHAKAEAVPEMGPVNPVPCLDKKERMFDKMVNLASSSHQNGRMGGKNNAPTKEAPPSVDADTEFLPKFVPEHKRYVCGVSDCNYLTCDDSMLRNHLKALHPDEQYYRCPHCQAQGPGVARLKLPFQEAHNVSIDKLAVHLKMHDTRLYKCSHCTNHHYHRHVVERHLSDKHSDMNPYVKVIREPASVEKEANAEETGEGTSDADGNHWKCCLCEYVCAYKPEMMFHATNVHAEKGQFRCNACSFKTNNRSSFVQHANAKHPHDLQVDCTLVYLKKLVGVAPKKPLLSPLDTALAMSSAAPTAAADSADTTVNPDEPFDTTPLWRRDMPRIRHIRGILFEDENPKTGSQVKSNKRKSDTDLSGLKASKSKKVAFENVENSDDGLAAMATGFQETEHYPDIDVTELIRKFGPFGTPIAHFFVCTICRSYKTKYRHDMRDHLYRDLKYWRYRCTLCGYMGISKTTSLRHFMKFHENRRPTEEESVQLPIDPEKEFWVQGLLKSQLEDMRSSSANAAKNAKSKKGTIAKPSKGESSKKSDGRSVKSSSIRESIEIVAESSKAVIDLLLAENLNENELEDEDSRDYDALVIDSAEPEIDDNLNSEVDESAPTGKTPFNCKHCGMDLPTVRAFKRHVKIRHLRRNTFLCLYCDYSYNAETLIIRHMRNAHAGLPETIVRNPTAEQSELGKDFWEKEYGLLTKQRAQKRKRADEEGPYDKVPGVYHVCDTCGFRALNYFGLSVHMRRHAAAAGKKDFKCAYCTYAAASKSDLWQHSEINHSSLDWKVGNGEIGASESGKEENISEPPTSNSTMNYSCFYCNFVHTNLDEVKEHWKKLHKSLPSTKKSEDTPSTSKKFSDLPFRYKEILPDPAKKLFRCGYCPKRGTDPQIRLHWRKNHHTKPMKFVEITVNQTTQRIAWVCQWCKEISTSKLAKKAHHNMFHSHLPINFKIQGTPAPLPGHACPECAFRSTSRLAMEKHVEKHVDSVICKRCDKTFPDVSIGILHNTQAHPGQVSKIEGFKGNIDKMLARVVWQEKARDEGKAFETVDKSALEGTWKNSVARKSTTKSSIIIQRPLPSNRKNVARKSTNPFPRYPPGVRFATPDDSHTFPRANFAGGQTSRGFSYYGKEAAPLNLSNINTYVTLAGGGAMKLNCAAFSQLIDIEPIIRIDDLKDDPRYSDLLANWKSKNPNSCENESRI